MSRYLSNLTPPPMTGFHLKEPPIQNCGHDIPSDPDFEPGCGFMELDDIAILYNTFQQIPGKTVVDIGARFGWTAKAIHQATGACVVCVDPILKFGTPERQRFDDNLGDTGRRVIVSAEVSQRFFLDCHMEHSHVRYSGFVIDGNHDDQEPLNDCIGAVSLAAEDAIILLHDGRGKPIYDAATWLMDQGWKCRFYYTPAGMFVCWRGFDGWEPPIHLEDSALDIAGMERAMDGFDFGRCS